MPLGPLGLHHEDKPWLCYDSRTSTSPVFHPLLTGLCLLLFMVPPCHYACFGSLCLSPTSVPLPMSSSPLPHPAASPSFLCEGKS